MEIAIFFIISVFYLATAERLGRWSITMPMFFVTAGIAFQRLGLPFTMAIPNLESIQLLAEITLVLLLFSDASSLNLRGIMDDAQMPGRLLLIGLPLTILLGALVARVMFPVIPLGMTFLLASVLAPTDAALGLPIFTNKLMPVRIRRALNVESGLNDGMVTPFVTLFLAMTLFEEEIMVGNWIPETLVDIGGALVVGIALGYVGGRFIRLAQDRKWASDTSNKLAILTSALACYTLATGLGVNGFVAAFTGGLAFGATSHHMLHDETEFTEDVGTLLSLLVWTIFGGIIVSVLIRDGFNALFWRSLLYALLSLTLIRMVPVWIALRTTGCRRDTIALMGWFGPRGLASVIFLLISVVAFDSAGQTAENLMSIVGMTVLLSVFLHGITAQPLVRWYARRLDAAEQADIELVEMPEVSPRRGMLGSKAASRTG